MGLLADEDLVEKRAMDAREDGLFMENAVMRRNIADRIRMEVALIETISLCCLQCCYMRCCCWWWWPSGYGIQFWGGRRLHGFS